MDYEAEDRWATLAGNAAAQSSPDWTLGDVCRALRWDLPTSEAELKHLARTCQRWGIRHNVETEPFYVRFVEDMRQMDKEGNNGDR